MLEVLVDVVHLDAMTVDNGSKTFPTLRALAKNDYKDIFNLNKSSFILFKLKLTYGKVVIVK